jgi:cysteinyl-tRNA synthetase
MHNGFVQIDNEKMSKSLGNFFTIRDVLAKYDAETVRFFLVRGHYRTALGYSDTHLNDARTGLKRLYTALDLVPPASDTTERTERVDWTNPYAQRFQSAMNDDFGTPEAIAVLYDLAGEVNRTKDKNLSQCLYQLGGVLGLLQQDPKTFLQAGAILDETAIQAKIAERAAAKAAKNFALADSIRKALLEQGIVLKDSATGTTWEVQS